MWLCGAGLQTARNQPDPKVNGKVAMAIWPVGNRPHRRRARGQMDSCVTHGVQGGGTLERRTARRSSLVVCNQSR